VRMERTSPTTRVHVHAAFQFGIDQFSSGFDHRAMCTDSNGSLRVFADQRPIDLVRHEGRIGAVIF